jgi:transcriptional regulator with XRE-family HTH domain
MTDPQNGDQTRRSTVEWEARIGEQVRARRLDEGLDQISLARLADVSTSTLQSLENGRGSTLRTLVRVLRALGAEAALDTITPTSTVSPLDLFRATATSPRRRVYRARGSRTARGVRDASQRGGPRRPGAGDGDGPGPGTGPGTDDDQGAGPR